MTISAKYKMEVPLENSHLLLYVPNPIVLSRLNIPFSVGTDSHSHQSLCSVLSKDVLP